MTARERWLSRVLVMSTLETPTTADAAVAHPPIELLAVMRGAAEILAMSTHLLTAEMMRRGAVMMGAATKTRVVAAAKTGMMPAAKPATAKVMAAATHMVATSTEPASVMTASTPSMPMTCRQI